MSARSRPSASLSPGAACQSVDLVELFLDDADLERRVQIPEQGVQICLAALGGPCTEREGYPLRIHRRNTGAHTIVVADEREHEPTRRHTPQVGNNKPLWELHADPPLPPELHLLELRALLDQAERRYAL